MTEHLTPISDKDRLHAIDMMRGFAIFGIFLVNIMAFISPWIYLEPGSWWTSPLDRATEIVIDLFAQASFYTLFSFLFGFGAVMIQERAIAKGQDFAPLFARRLFILLIIGIIHAFLIWHGDILMAYASIGFLLLLFHKRKPKTLFVWALCLILIPTLLFGGFFTFLSLVVPDEFSTDPFQNELVQQSLEVYSSGSYVEITKQRVADWSYVNIAYGMGLFFQVLTLLPMFLLGMFFAKKKWLHNVNESTTILKRWWLGALIVMVAFKGLPYLSQSNFGLQYIQDSLGGPAAAIFYATSIALLSRFQRASKSMRPLAYVGKMSLSNYLLQSIVSTLIFYGYGLGLYGKVSLFQGIFYVMIFYLLQVLLSKWWMTHFRFGPVEWVWRTLTYGIKQPFKIRNSA